MRFDATFIIITDVLVLARFSPSLSDIFPLRVFSFVKAKWRFSATLRKLRRKCRKLSRERDLLRDNNRRINGFDTS